MMGGTRLWTGGALTAISPASLQVSDVVLSALHMISLRPPGYARMLVILLFPPNR